MTNIYIYNLIILIPLKTNVYIMNNDDKPEDKQLFKQL